MARSVERRTRRDGVVRIRRAPRLWRCVVALAAGLGLLGPIALGLFVDLPPVVFAIPQMVIWIIIWEFFRRLDAPRPTTPPAPPPGSRARVLRLPQRSAVLPAVGARRRLG